MVEFLHDESIRDEQLVPLSEQTVRILVTDADKNGNEISRMSDFMGLYANQLTTTLSQSSFAEIINYIPIAEFGILNEVIHQGKFFSKGKVTLVPDFDSLPAGIRRKLDKGIYKLGESKQVDGNLRPVILNEKGVRVKDLTLKHVISHAGSIEAIRSIISQLQMKQICDQLADIQAIQKYQLDNDRGHAIFVPFFNARDEILRAQNAKTVSERNDHLEKAADYLTTAKNAVIEERKHSLEHLAKNSKKPILHFSSTIRMLTTRIADDLQLSTRICGLIMQVYEYLGQPHYARQEYDHFIATMQDFVTQKVLNSGYTGIELVHDNFKYNAKNLDCWLDFSSEMKQKLIDRCDMLDSNETYILTLEDANND